MKAESVSFQFEGREITARPGITLSAALWEAGIRGLRTDRATDRGVWCGIGHCFECRVAIDGAEGIRACMVLVRPGMSVVREPDREGSPWLR